MNLLRRFFCNPNYGKTALQKDAECGLVNEREVRAVAGLMFAIGLTTLLTTFFTNDFRLALFVIPIFFFEFAIKVFIGPQTSMLAVLVRPLIANQTPEMVGAIQKRFAWSLGMVFAATVFIVIFILQIRGFLPLFLCSFCLLLMWLESATGICLGCLMHAKLV